MILLNFLFQGRVAVPSVQDPWPFNLAAATHKVVRSGGTVGVNCDYTTISAAIADLEGTASISNQFVLDIKNGNYFLEQGPINRGLYLRNYIHWVGESKEGVVVTGPAMASGFESTASVIEFCAATCLVKNVTLNAFNNKYAIHMDYSIGGFDLYFDNIITDHLGSQDGFLHDVGFGLYDDQKATFTNCTFTGGGFYGHNNATADRFTNNFFELLLQNCTMGLLLYQEYIEYVANKITLNNNTIGTVDLRTSTAVYDANPSNPACNQGFKTFTNIVRSGNTVTTLIRDTETASILGTTMNGTEDF